MRMRNVNWGGVMLDVHLLDVCIVTVTIRHKVS